MPGKTIYYNTRKNANYSELNLPTSFPVLTFLLNIFLLRKLFILFNLRTIIKT